MFGLAVIVVPVQAELNRWVDEEGNVHYGDSVPSQYLGKGRAVLSPQGVVIEEVKPMKSEEELTEEARLLNIKKQAMIEQKKKDLRDRVLLDTFTTERDILMERDARVDAIDSQINLTETIIKDHEKKVKQLKTHIESIEKSGREVPQNTLKELEGVSKQLETHYQYVEVKSQEREKILHSFDEDIRRFRELKQSRHQK
jgi:hypothetical protein